MSRIQTRVFGAGLLVVVVAVAVVGFWRSAASDGCGAAPASLARGSDAERRDEAERIDSCNLLDQKSEAAVRRALGKPRAAERVSATEITWDYELGQDAFGDFCHLYVTFVEDHRVARVTRSRSC